MNIKKHLILLYVCLFINVFGQKKEFVINQNQDVVFSKISDFKNDYTENGIQAGIDSLDGEQVTYIVLENIREQDSYLTLKLNKNAKAEQFLQKAIWKTSTKAINPSTTKVTIELESIQLDDFSKKDMDSKQTKSTGKLEKEIEAYLKDSSIYIISEDKTDNEYPEAIDVSSEVVDAVATAAKQQIDFENITNRKIAVSTTLKTLFGKGLISLPTTDKKFSQLLKKSPNILSCEDCINKEFYSWDFEDYFNIIYVKMNDNLEYYSLQYSGEKEVSGLPYGLAFNGSSPTECRDKFARYDAQLYQTTVNVDENTSNALTVVTFKMNTSYIRLEFGNEYLTKIILSNQEQ